MGMDNQQGSNDYFKKGGDMKSSLIYAATNVAMKAEAATRVEDSIGVEAWAALVKGFDSMVYPLIIGDEVKLKERIKVIKDARLASRQHNKTKHFDGYNAWFRFLCNVLHKIDAYPEKKVHLVMERTK